MRSRVALVRVARLYADKSVRGKTVDYQVKKVVIYEDYDFDLQIEAVGLNAVFLKWEDEE